jgi:hypothetical protein
MRGLTFDSAHLDHPRQESSGWSAKVKALVITVLIVGAAADFAAGLVVDSQHRSLSNRIHSVEVQVFP